MVNIGKETELASYIPSKDEVNRLFGEVVQAKTTLDFAHRCCTDGLKDRASAEFSTAQQNFLSAVNARRILRGNPPYATFSDIPIKRNFGELL